ncbi:MAG: hypothetical protein ACREIZ_02360 [Candidatus Methylomirabilales bacterium]
MDEGWSDAEIRVLRERIAMERRRAERKAVARRKQPRPLVPRRALPKEVRRPAGTMPRRRRLAS